MMDEYQEVGSTDHSCVYETRNVPLYRSWALRSLPQLNKRIPDNAALIRVSTSPMCLQLGLSPYLSRQSQRFPLSRRFATL